MKHEHTSKYSPHQNGTAKQNWRTLFDIVRCMLIESKLPKSLWTYSIMIATHIRNRCYSGRINNTPFGITTKNNQTVPNYIFLAQYATIMKIRNWNHVVRLDTLLDMTGKALHVFFFHVLYCHDRNNNQGAIPLTRNPIKHTRSKHIDIRYHFIRESLLSEKITLECLPSNESFY